MISGATCDFWFNSFKAQLAEIEIINIDIDDTDRIVLGYVVIQCFRE